MTRSPLSAAEITAVTRALVEKKYVDSLSRLRGHLPEDADDVFAQGLLLARLSTMPQTADELYRFATMLAEQWPTAGIVATTGWGLRVSALMLGAEPPT